MWDLFVSSTAAGLTARFISSAHCADTEGARCYNANDGALTLETTEGGRVDAAPVPSAACAAARKNPTAGFAGGRYKIVGDGFGYLISKSKVPFATPADPYFQPRLGLPGASSR
jgi:hypothetical protein